MHTQLLFGQILKELRTPAYPAKKIRVPDICKEISCAKSLWYRFEKGQETTMKRDVLERIIRFFNIDEHSVRWYELINSAYLAHDSIPFYLRDTTPRLMHIVFMNLHMLKPTETEFLHAMQCIKNARVQA